MSRRVRRRQAMVAGEFEGIDLGDPRRDRRAAVVAEKLASEPEASLPGAMAGRAMPEILYRHLSNESVDFAALLEPHIAKCAVRVEVAGETSSCCHHPVSRRWNGSCGPPSRLPTVTPVVAYALLLARKGLPQAPTVCQALLAIAALGGHIKNNGDPGWQVLGRGWRGRRGYELGYRLARGHL